MTIKMGNRISSLDGLRAFSILLVMVSHSGIGDLSRFIDLGNLGVRFFFIISSYLIIGILYEDTIKSKLNLRRFYFKRVLRTFPAFYFYLFVVAIVLLFLGLFDINQFWRAPLYLENYHPRSSWTKMQWFVGHSWSLAVEEQFYILSAILFYTLRNNINLKFAVTKWLFAIVIIIPFLRIAYSFIPGIPNFLTGSIHRSFETVADSLAIGGLAYLFKNEITALSFYKKLEKNSSILILLISVFFLQFLGSKFLVTVLGYIPRILYSGLGISIMQVIIAFLIIILIHKQQDFIWVIFNNEIIVLIGKWSYAIYLWQQIWFYTGWSMSLWERILGIFITSCLSYYLIEIPAIKWRDVKLKLSL